ncbi:MAG: GtrA family protein [Dehalococcoidia bacterium]|jgi:putative flippase GtrA
MTKIEGAALAGGSAEMPCDGGTVARIWRLILSLQQPLLVRYVLVSGVVGLPASILQLALLLFLYRVFFGPYSTLQLNLMWIINFELGLLRNFGCHCLYTWRMRPTWRRLWHAHVAAVGAFVIDIIVFNVIVFVTGIIPLAQLFGAGSGFAVNFTYNKLKTFTPLPQIGMKGGTPSES